MATATRKFQDRPLEFWQSVTVASFNEMTEDDRQSMQDECLGILQDIEQSEREEGTPISREPYATIFNW